MKIAISASLCWPLLSPGSAVALDRVLDARQPFLQVRRRHHRNRFYFRIQSEEETLSYVGNPRSLLRTRDQKSSLTMIDRSCNSNILDISVMNFSHAASAIKPSAPLPNAAMSGWVAATVN